MTKGFSASYVNEYNTSAGNYFSVGEFWDGFDLIKSWITNCSNNSTSFDFPVKYALNQAMWNGGMDLTKLIWLANGTTKQPAGLIHSTGTKRYAVTFVDNHDTYRNTDKFVGNVLAANAFLLGSPGVPCIFLPHWNANKAAITAMIKARRAVQLHSESPVTVNQSATNIYVATVTGISGTLIVKIGSGSYTAPGDYTLAASGTDYAMWTKISTMAPYLSVSPAGGTYYTAQTVSMSTSTGATIYYTTDNTAPTTSSTPYSIPLNISGTTTLRAIAYNPTTQLYSDESVNSYIITTAPTAITVRFKAPAGWTSCRAYFFVNNAPLGAGWPGTAMTLESDGYYSYTVSGFTSLPVGIVFNNGSGSQTVDLFASKDMCWDAGALSGSNYTATEVICLGTAVKETRENNLGIYPNPSHGQLTVESKQKGQITVYNLQGKRLLLKNLDSATENLDLSAFGKGIYLLRFEGKEGISYRKVVVE
jgi:alpha-amylase